MNRPWPKTHLGNVSGKYLETPTRKATHPTIIITAPGTTSPARSSYPANTRVAAPATQNDAPPPATLSGLRRSASIASQTTRSSMLSSSRRRACPSGRASRILMSSRSCSRSPGDFREAHHEAAATSTATKTDPSATHCPKSTVGTVAGFARQYAGCGSPYGDSPSVHAWTTGAGRIDAGTDLPAVVLSARRSAPLKRRELDPRSRSVPHQSAVRSHHRSVDGIEGRRLVRDHPSKLVHGQDSVETRFGARGGAREGHRVNRPVESRFAPYGRRHARERLPLLTVPDLRGERKALLNQNVTSGSDVAERVEVRFAGESVHALPGPVLYLQAVDGQRVFVVAPLLEGQGSGRHESWHGTCDQRRPEFHFVIIAAVSGPEAP